MTGRRHRLLALLLASTLASAVAPARAQDYKLAPSEQEMDARAEQYVQNRRIMAILLVGGTFVAGLMGSVIRRRARRRAHDQQLVDTNDPRSPDDGET